MIPAPPTTASELVVWLVAAWQVAWAAAYMAYTPGGVAALRPALGRPRRLAVAAGFAALIGATASLGGWLWPLPLAVGAAATAWIAWRQWLIPRPVPRLEPREVALPPGAPLALLPSGAGIPVTWLQRLRVARAGDLLVVHCAVAGSLAAFRAPPGIEVRAVLPHASGFELGGGGRRWDGVDGRALDGGVDLERIAADVVPLGAPPGPATLLGPSGPVPPLRTIHPVVGGARGVSEPMAPGVVEGGRWCPADDAPRGATDRYALARWAAIERGLTPR